MRDGASEFSFTSSLQGLALQLPAPLAKAAEDAMPLRIEKKIVLREARRRRAPLVQDRISVELGRVASATYVRDISGASRACCAAASASAWRRANRRAAPERGVLANIQLARLDVAAWQALFGEATGKAGRGGRQRRRAPTTRSPTCPPSSRCARRNSSSAAARCTTW